MRSPSSPAALVKPSFFTVIVWRGQAEHAAESPAKGSRVGVVGPFDRNAAARIASGHGQRQDRLQGAANGPSPRYRACGNDDGGEGGTTADGDKTGTSAKEGSEPILIKTHVAPQTRGARRLGRFFPGPALATQPSAPGGALSMALRSPRSGRRKGSSAAPVAT